MYFNNKRLTILIVSSFLPYPLNAGGKIRIYKLCKLLSDRYDFILLSLIKDERELQYVPQLNKIFKEIHIIIKRSLPKSLLYPVSYFGSYSEYLIKKFKEILKKVSVDIVQLESNELLYLTDFVKKIPIVYTEHDINALSLRYSYYPRIGSFLSYMFDYFKRINYHKHFYKNLDIIITLSERDAKWIKLFIPNKPIYCLPTGVDLSYFSYKNNEDNLNKIIFVGWYGHYPNIDAVLYFSKRIFPLIKKRVPDVEFFIVGGEYPNIFDRLSRQNGIKLIGEAPDIRKYLNLAKVFVSPLRLGGGIKTKVLEAMATGLPVVATEKGIEGIVARDNEEFLLATTPASFAENVFRLFNDEYLRKKLSLNARRLVEKDYDLSKIAQKLDMLYKYKIPFIKLKMNYNNYYG